MIKTRKPAPRPNINVKALPVLALAGRAVLTFRNMATGTHMTVRLKQWRDKQDRKVRLPIYSVEISLLGDRRSGYEYAGTYFSDTKRVKLGRNVTHDSRTGRAFAWLIAAIHNPEPLRGRVGLFHEGRCCECGMPLTHPESINTALGPVCLRRIEERLRRDGGKFQLAEMFETVDVIQM
jgi:Family of unknown function (DUF6011)